MIKTCNNCNVDYCAGNSRSICSNHKRIVSIVPLRLCISKVTIKDVEKATKALNLFKSWM